MRKTKTSSTPELRSWTSTAPSSTCWADARRKLPSSLKAKTIHFELEPFSGLWSHLKIWKEFWVSGSRSRCQGLLATLESPTCRQGWCRTTSRAWPSSSRESTELKIGIFSSNFWKMHSCQIWELQQCLKRLNKLKHYN